MKKVVLPFLLLLAAAMLLAASEETFALKNSQLRISIEHHYQRNGMTPVQLYGGGLEITGMMDENGRVFLDKTQARIGTGRSLFTVDQITNVVAIGRESSSAAVEEKNPIRTRLRLLRGDLAPQLTLDLERGGGELRLGDACIRLAVRAQECSLGVFALQLISPNVEAEGTLFLVPVTGLIHQAGPGTRPVDPEACPVWAQRLNRGDER